MNTNQFKMRLYAFGERAIFVGCGLLLMRLSALFVSIIIARVAGADTFGEYSLFVTIFIIMNEVGVAFDTNFIRLSSSTTTEYGDEHYFVVNVFSKFVFASVFTSVAYVFSDVIAIYVFNKEAATGIIFYAVFAGTIVPVFTSMTAFYQYRSRFGYVALMMPMNNIVVLLLISSMFFMGLTISQERLQVVYLLSAFSLGLYPFFLAVKWFKGSIRDLFFEVFIYYKHGWSFVLASIVALIANRLDVFFLSANVSFNELGLYGAAVRISVILGIMNGVVTMILSPKASRIVHAQGDVRNYWLESCLFISAQVAVLVILIIFLEEIIDIIFGSEYMGINDISLLLLIQTVIMTCTIPFHLLVKFGKINIGSLYLAIIKLIVTSLLLIFLVPEYGVLGAGYSMVTAAIIMFFITIWLYTFVGKKASDY